MDEYLYVNVYRYIVDTVGIIGFVKACTIFRRIVLCVCMYYPGYLYIKMHTQIVWDIAL